MHRIDQPTAVNTLPTPAAAGTPGYFTGGNPGTGSPATVLDADWANNIQEELMSILAAASISPLKTANNQVLSAIDFLISASPKNFGSPAQYTNQTATLPASIVENVVYLGGSGNILTLPTTASTQVGQIIIYVSGGASGSFVAQGSDTIDRGGSTSTTLIVNSYDWGILYNETAGHWSLIAGSALGRIQFLQIANNLSDVSNAATALSNLGGLAIANQIGGSNQSWIDETGSRSLGTTYTNSTGRPILVSVAISTSSSTYNAYCYVGSVKVAYIACSSSAFTFASCQFIVPSGATYEVVTNAGSGSLQQWSELR